MFAVPRPKKSILPPPGKKRKAESAVEEVSFDNDARQEYLTGFHKRKQQRIKLAQAEAAKKAHQDKLEARRQLREERRRDAEQHVEKVNEMLREAGALGDLEEGEGDGDEDKEAVAGAGSDDEFTGFPDKPDLEIVDHEEEYIDEDRYTTVTVESVSVSRDGFGRLRDEDGKDEEWKNRDNGDEDTEKNDGTKSKVQRPPKKKQPKFRYETKTERKLTEAKQRVKKARRRA